jgi:HAD superfamily hydrolase (TIGR01509 family)
MEKFGLLFDMDGLMLDTERMARVAWIRALAEQGFQLDDISYLRMVGRTVQDARLILGEIFGPDLPFQRVFDQRQAYYDADIDENGIVIKPGLLELLGFLEANDIPKAVASSTPGWFATRKLARAGIDQRFIAIVCGDMVAHGKPAPDLFLEAARRIALPPERCVVLEDSEAGIVAAHTAGMIPVMIPDLKQPVPEIRALAYQVLSSLHEAIPLVEDFLRNGLPQTG